MEYVEPLGDKYLLCYQDLCKILTGELGLSLLSSIDYLEFAKDVMDIMDNLLSLKVFYDCKGIEFIREWNCIVK